MRRALLILALVGCGDNVRPPREVLLYTATTGHRHEDSIEIASTILPARLAASGITSVRSEQPASFRDAALERFDAVIFLYTSGNDILDAEGKLALEAFVRRGGGWLGVHSASDTETEWPFYRELVIGHYAGHPIIQDAVMDIVDREHPATVPLPDGRWTTADEWYNFDRAPQDTPGVQILMTVDETTYVGGTMGDPHAVVWAHDRMGGRALYSAIGHIADRWNDPAYVEHIAGAVSWVIGD